MSNNQQKNNPTTGISHQNKDILMKVLSQNYQNKSLAVYGLNIPKIKRMLPTGLPVVTNEYFGDNMFLLENNELLCLEYESKVSWLDFLKYTEYVTRKIRQLFTEGIRVHKVIIAVIYTADVKSTSAELDLCGLHIKVEQVFLSKFDTNALYAGLKAKIESGEKLSDEDVMRFIILPLTQPNKIRKQKLIKETVDLAKQVKNEDQQAFILAGILTAADKFIDQKFAESVREWLKMSKVIRLFIEEGIEQGIEQGKKAKAIETALELLKLGLSIDIISKGTNLPESEIEQLQLQTTKTVNA